MGVVGVIIIRDCIRYIFILIAELAILGLHFELPCVEHCHVVDMRTHVMSVPPQEVHTIKCSCTAEQPYNCIVSPLIFYAAVLLYHLTAKQLYSFPVAPH